MEELFRKMGSVYPILEKEEPPDGKPEPGGQEEEEEEPGNEEHDEWEQWQESWMQGFVESDSWREEEKYLEEACHEVQRETWPAKPPRETRSARTRPRNLTEAREEFERDQAAGRKALQAATEKYRTRMKGKKGVQFPEMPHETRGRQWETRPTSPQTSTYDLPPFRVHHGRMHHEFITDDESDKDHYDPEKMLKNQFLYTRMQHKKENLPYKHTSIPDNAYKCLTKVAEGVKDMEDKTKEIERRRAMTCMNNQCYQSPKSSKGYKGYECYDGESEPEKHDTPIRHGNRSQSVPLAKKKSKKPPECLLASHLPGLFRNDCILDKEMKEKYHRSFKHDCEDTENTSGDTSEEEPDGPERWVRAAKDLGVNQTKHCEECYTYSTRIEFTPVHENLREFLYLIRHAEVLVDLERMTRKRDEATSKKQQKKLDKQIRKKRAKYSATHILNQILKEERARTDKERIRQEGKIKKQSRQMPNPTTNTDSDRDREAREEQLNQDFREEQLDWVHAYTKYAEYDEPDSREKDRQEDRYLKDASGKLVETFVKWRLSEIAEIRSAEDIVTISSDSEFSGDSDCDQEAYKKITGSTEGYKCKCREGHESKKDTIECLAKKDYEAETTIWAEAINELGNALKREEVPTKTLARLANDIRVEALVMGIRKDSPPEPKFTGGALRPKNQECHQGDLYEEAKCQARQEKPPTHTYVYNGPADSWLKYFASPSDVLTYILGKISQTAERTAIRSKIDSMVALSKCFQEITHREEVARKGYAVGKNLRQYDGGKRIEKKARKLIVQWANERARYERVQRDIINMAEEEPPRKPGPTTKCDGCQKVPDSKLRQCGRCRHALYCTIKCQRRQWPNHKEKCEYWVLLRQARGET